MKNYYTRKWKMYSTVKNVMLTNSEAWVSSQPFKNEVDSLELKLLQIDEHLQKIRATVGISEQKRNLCEQMCNEGSIICGAGMAFGEHCSDKEIKAQFNYTPSDLMLGNEKTIYHRCLSISKAAEPLLANLNLYQLPANQLEKLNALIEAFGNLIAMPRQLQSANKSIREDVKNLFRDCDQLLKLRLDKMMLVYKKSNQEFFNQYRHARFIGGWNKVKTLKQNQT